MLFSKMRSYRIYLKPAELEFCRLNIMRSAVFIYSSIYKNKHFACSLYEAKTIILIKYTINTQFKPADYK
jgi:hypothetical protein